MSKKNVNLTKKEDSLELKLKEFIENDPERNPGDYYIRDGKVCCRSGVRIHNDDLVDGRLPFHFYYVNSLFSCRSCPSLISLEGCPEYVGGEFDCSDNPELKSLEGGPIDISGDFYCNVCYGLTSLVGSPERVGGNFNCSSNYIISLVGAPKEVGGDFDCSYNDGEDFTKENLPVGTMINGEFNCIY